MTEYDDLLEEVLPEREAKPDTKPKRPAPKKKWAKSASKTQSPKAEPLPVSATPARRGMSRLLERTGRCPMYAPRGTVCKSCGKVHPQ